MTCGQLKLGGCGNPDLSHDGPCTPYRPGYTGVDGPMRENPIRKMNPPVQRQWRDDTGRWQAEVVKGCNLDGPKKQRQWGFKCPYCGYTYVTGQKTKGRKLAKDLLYKHTKAHHGLIEITITQHGGPGLGV